MTKTTKTKYRIRNWAEYNKSLVNRGRLNVWFSEDVVEKWNADPSSGRGRPRVFQIGLSLFPRYTRICRRAGELQFSNAIYATRPLTSENWRDCVTQIQETISVLKNSALSEVVLNPRLNLSLQNARISFTKKVIGNRFPISEQKKTDLAINLLRSMDSFFEPKMIMKELGKLANSLAPMELLSDEQRQTGEVLLDVLMKTFMAHVLFLLLQKGTS